MFEYPKMLGLSEEEFEREFFKGSIKYLLAIWTIGIRILGTMLFAAGVFLILMTVFGQ